MCPRRSRPTSGPTSAPPAMARAPSPVSPCRACCARPGATSEADESLRAAQLFSWRNDPWLALEAAWRALPAPRTDAIPRRRGRLRRRARLLSTRAPRRRPSWNGRVIRRGPSPPPGPHRWTRGRAWLRLTPATAAAEYAVTLEMGTPFPSPLERSDVQVTVNGGPPERITRRARGPRRTSSARARGRASRSWCASTRRPGARRASRPIRACGSRGSASRRPCRRRPTRAAVCHCQRKIRTAIAKLTTPQTAEQRQLGRHGHEARAFQHHRAQGVVERGQGQGLDEGLDRVREALGREEDAGEDPHRHHHEVHDPGDAFDRPRPRRGEQAEAAEGQRAQQRDRGQQQEGAAQGHVEDEVARRAAAPPPPGSGTGAAR